MQFGLEGEQQVLLGGNSGLRGYNPREFSGTKRIRLNLESRTIFWEHPLIVVGSAIFADVGYIWTGDAVEIGIPRRSVGFGLRLGIPKLSGSRVYRADLAYPLDGPGRPSFKPVFTYAIGHAF
jgi:hemolysin activation/secretion protein